MAKDKTHILALHAKNVAEGKTFANRERAIAAGIKGGAALRNKYARNRSMQEIAKWLGKMTITKGELLAPEEIQDLEKAKEVNMTIDEAMMLAQYQKALAGDTKAAEFIRDTAGEKPKEQIEVQGMTIDEYAQNHKPKF